MFSALQTYGDTLRTVADVHLYAEEALGNAKKADRFMERSAPSPSIWHQYCLAHTVGQRIPIPPAAGHKMRYLQRTNCKTSLSATQAAKSQHHVRAPVLATATA